MVAIMIDNVEHIDVLDDILYGRFGNFEVSFIHKTTVDFNLRTDTRAMAFGLLHRLNHYYHELGHTQEWYSMADNYIEFVEHNFGIELAAMSISGAKQSPYNLPFNKDDMPKYKSFLERNSHYYGNSNV